MIFFELKIINIIKICLHFSDATSALRLELVLNSSLNNKNTLYEVLNFCITIGGKRRLRSTILQPSSDIQLIHDRQEAIAEIISNQDLYVNLLKVHIIYSKFNYRPCL